MHLILRPIFLFLCGGAEAGRRLGAERRNPNGAGGRRLCRKKQAYVAVGRIPVTNGKMALGKMEVLVKDDPEMRRPCVVIEANARKFPQTNATGARALADWLVGEKGQGFLVEYGREKNGGIPLYFPVSVP